MTSCFYSPEKYWLASSCTSFPCCDSSLYDIKKNHQRDHWAQPRRFFLLFFWLRYVTYPNLNSHYLWLSFFQLKNDPWKEYRGRPTRWRRTKHFWWGHRYLCLYAGLLQGQQFNSHRIEEDSLQSSWELMKLFYYFTRLFFTQVTWFLTGIAWC